ncbi:MAG: hypothetical protein K8F27_04195 [Sulfuricellaceae bacterium]|nr:hypothetical protein [Sulfuricellaceae bacterium]
MLQRIREVCGDVHDADNDGIGFLRGIVEADETYYLVTWFWKAQRTLW